MNTEWCTIESDPAVFSELIEKMGVKDLSVEEIIAIQDSFYINSLKPIHGFIFLFRWDDQKPYKPERNCISKEDIFFARQVITNNCATQAILSIIMNKIKNEDLGEELKNFKDFSIYLDPLTRGEVIGQSEHIRTIHNSFAKPDGFLYVRDPNDKRKGKKQDAFHFVSYIKDENSNCVYELDGLRNGPILLGEESEAMSWIDIVLQEVQDRMDHYSSNEIRFALLAIINSTSKKIKKEIRRLENNIKKDLAKIKHVPKENDIWNDINFEYNNFIDNSFDEPQSEDPKKEIENLNRNYNLLIIEKENLKEDDEKKKIRSAENERRKHNYIPFIFELLKLGAEKGILQDFYEEAKKK